MAEKKSFVNYVADSKREYNYVLKFALNEMTDVMVDQLEACLKKYDLKSASAFRKTPIQESPLDFPNVKNTSVHSCDMTLGYPGSLDFLRIYICNNLGISPALLAVHSENDPRRGETDLYIDRNSPEYKETYKARLGADHEETDVPAYGQTYNTEFLKELAKVAKERQITTVENPLSPGEKVDHTMMPKDYDGFNDPKNLKKDDVGLFGRIKKPNLMKVGML